MNMLSNLPKVDVKLFRKIYEGEYSYQKDKTSFSEEKFEVYRNKEKMSVLYNAEIFSRTQEGVAFEAKVQYLMSKDYIPQLVLISKKMGKENATEIYDFIEKTSTIEYQFLNNTAKEKREIKTPTKFQIATPCTVCSLTFLLSKKFDTNQINYYSVLKSPNNWDFEETPEFIEIGARRTSESQKILRIQRHKVKSTPFVIFETNEGEQEKDHLSKEGINILLSPHLGMPYSNKDLDDTIVEVRILKNLLSEDT